MTTNTDPELDACIQRLAATFSPCPNGNGHRWNYDTGKCEQCGAAFPYAAPSAPEPQMRMF